MPLTASLSTCCLSAVYGEKDRGFGALKIVVARIIVLAIMVVVRFWSYLCGF